MARSSATARHPRLVRVVRCIAAWGALLATATAAVADDGPEALTILSWGGAYEAAQREALFEPFTRETGIAIRVERYDGGLEELRTAQDDDGPPWDLIDMTMSDAMAACRQGLLEQLDPGLLTAAPDGTPPRRDFQAGAFSDCAIAHTVFATVVAYDRTAFPGNRPTRIRDLFDRENFPGPRALQRGPAANLEWAMLSYNVPREELYGLLSTPRGLRLALRRLEDLGDAVHWWRSAEEPAELLADGEVVMASGYNGRFFDVMVNRDAPIEILWDGQLQEFEAWTVPQGAAHPDAARAFIRFATRSDRLTAFAERLPYGPARRSAAEQVGVHEPSGRDMRLYIPTHPLNEQRAVRKDEAWYASVHDVIHGRFRDWLRSRDPGTQDERRSPDRSPE